MTSKLIVNSIRHTGASADAITMDASGNVTFPANATCSGTATGFGGGKLLQTLQNTDNTTVTATSGDTAIISLAITPSATNSKILVQGNFSGKGIPGSNTFVTYRLFRGTTSGTNIYTGFSGANSNFNGSYNQNHLIFLDSPNTTSATTYTLAFRTGSVNTNSVTTDGADYVIILQEIGA